jgi:hypothetical protein
MQGQRLCSGRRGALAQRTQHPRRLLVGETGVCWLAHGGSFGLKAPRLEAYFNSHLEYAREALPLLETNRRAANRQRAIISGQRHIAELVKPLTQDG